VYQRPHRARVVFVVLLLAAVAVLTLDFRERDGGPVERLQQTAVGLFGPLQRGLAAVFRPVGGAFGAVGGVFSLSGENRELKAEVERLRQQERTYQDLLSENQELRGVLGMAERCGCETVGAQVVARSGSNFQWSVTIDAGRRQGVAKDMAVINADGLVGRVVQVSASYATVQLINDPSSGVAASLSASNTPGLLHGRGDDGLSLELLKSDASVEAGEPVVTQGYADAVFPPGIPIGVVREAPPPESLVRRVKIDPFVATDALDAVAVVVTAPEAPPRPPAEQPKEEQPPQDPPAPENEPPQQAESQQPSSARQDRASARVPGGDRE
jgi:rod shape-determining protein MreC